jgi:hypothetical protein
MNLLRPLLIAALLLPAAYGQIHAARHNPAASQADVSKIQAARTALRHASIETKVQYLLDRDELTDLVTAYAYGVDTRDWALHTSIFTPNYEINTEGEWRKDTTDKRGKHLMAFFKKFEATQHLVFPQTISIDGDTAYVTSTLHARHYHSNGDPKKNTLLFGHYEFWCTRTADGWRIARMAMVNRTQFITAPGHHEPQPNRPSPPDAQDKP